MSAVNKGLKGMTARRGTISRRVAGQAYPFKCCVVCGISQEGVLDVAHLDGDPLNDNPDNLAFLCKTHHRMYDMGLYPVEAIKLLREHWQRTSGKPDHSLYMKDAGVKAAKIRKKSAAARKAWVTRRTRDAHHEH